MRLGFCVWFFFLFLWHALRKILTLLVWSSIASKVVAAGIQSTSLSLMFLLVSERFYSVLHSVFQMNKISDLLVEIKF